jgi:hypothetical protein
MEPGLEGNRPGRLNSPTILGHTPLHLRRPISFWPLLRDVVNPPYWSNG